MTHIKHSFISVAIFALLMLSVPAQSFSQTFLSDPTFKSQKTTSDYIAVLFYKITGQIPNFKNWILQSKSYKDAPSFDKDLILNQKIVAFEDFFTLLNFQDPITVETMVAISKYSQTNKGFLIHSLNASTFYNFKFLDEHFAVIPQDAEKYQWVSIPHEDFKRIERDIKRNKRLLRARIVMTPTYGSKSAPITIDDKPHWLISATIDNIELWGAGSGRASRKLWESNKAWRGRGQNEILNLYQR